MKYVLDDIIKFKNTLDETESRYLIIKVHNVPLSTTAFILDYSQATDCKILLDYKVYNGNRENSYGIEYQNSNKTITRKVLDSYLSITKSAHEIKDIEEIDNI